MSASVLPSSTEARPLTARHRWQRLALASVRLCGEAGHVDEQLVALLRLVAALRLLEVAVLLAQRQQGLRGCARGGM